MQWIKQESCNTVWYFIAKKVLERGGNGNANVIMVTQNRVSGGARDRFFGGAGEGFLAILGFKRFFGQVFLADS